MELTADTVRQVQLGPQQAAEPLEEGEMAEAKCIDAGFVKYDIVLGTGEGGFSGITWARIS